MTNLPIMTSTPQTAAPAQQAANSAESEGAQGSQAFGQVLARQIGATTGKDAKADDRLVSEVLARLVANVAVNKKDATDLGKDIPVDTGKTDATAPAPGDSAATLPNDMLAALMPQMLNAPAAAPATGGGTDNTPASTVTGQDRQLPGTAVRAEAAPAIQPGDTSQREPAATGPAKEQSFAAALSENASRGQSAAELRAATRDAVAAVAPQQNSAAMLAALQNNAAVAAAAMPSAQASVNTPVGQDRWGDEFSQKITWLASSRLDQTAELHLNPPQLGPVDVVLKVSGDQATALFTSPHAAVREAIEQAMPKLRDMMADNGIMLGNATVSDQAPRDQGQQPAAQHSSTSTGSDLREAVPASSGTPRVSQISRHNGIVDTFA